VSKAERKARRAARDAYRKGLTRSGKGPCFVEACSRRGRVEQSCVLCESQGEHFLVAACPGHTGKARAKVKRHVLLKHPGTIPAAFAAALTGRDMT
jgi:hypothetical protein